MLLHTHSIVINYETEQTEYVLTLQEDLNILQNLSPVEFAEVRALVIDMVLATDMSAHFEHVRQMRLLLSAPERYIQCKCV